jgi:ferredoxin-NADP reductase
MHVSLLYSSKTVADVLLRTELDALLLRHPRRFELWHTITTPAPTDDIAHEVNFLQGRVNRRMLEETLYAPSLQSAAFVCGPPPMVESVMASLELIGYTVDGLLEF